MAQPGLLPNWLDLPLELWAHMYKRVGGEDFACVCK